MIHADDCHRRDQDHLGPCTVLPQKDRALDGPGRPASFIPTDLVNHPPHYKANGIEVIEVIEAFDLPAHLANVVKYVLRASRKTGTDTLTDLKKARWYVDRYIQRLEAGQ